MPFTRLNTIVLAPMPSASDRTMMKVVPGWPGHETRGKTGVVKELTQKVADSHHGGIPRLTCPSQSAVPSKSAQ